MTAGDFAGRVALVTGAGSGLGKQFAIDLARCGAKVVVNSVLRGAAAPSKAEMVAEGIRAEGLHAIHDVSNMAVEAEARGAIEHTVREYGRIDILVSNAGGTVAGTAQGTSTATLREVMELNLFGMFWATQQALKHMRTQNYGRIIITSSGLGSYGAPGQFSYVTAKAGAIGLTKAAAHDNRDKNIRINALAPIAYTGRVRGFDKIDPRFNEDSLSVARVSPAVLFLAHENCPFSGEVLHAAGGRVARTFSATTKGYASPTLSYDEILDRLDEVMDMGEIYDFERSADQYAIIPSFGYSV